MIVGYNETEPYAAQWLRNLSAVGLIASGDVDERSIADLTGWDVIGHDQYHFFAGIGVWSYALKLAQWPEGVSVWTGSCPCQPFSQSGKRARFTDDRHLWPEWFRLIDECKPPVILGEQVASPDGLKWLDPVFSDMENAGYACGAVDTCSAGSGAPHIRQRLIFAAVRVANADDTRRKGRRESVSECSAERSARQSSVVSRVADTNGAERSTRIRDYQTTRYRDTSSAASIYDRSGSPGPTNGFWGSADWIKCRNGVYRPVEPGTFPMADGTPARVGRLRAYGNAVDAQATADFVRAVMRSIFLT